MSTIADGASRDGFSKMSVSGSDVARQDFAEPGTPADSPSGEAAAASTIQRNYRGYRARREMTGLGLDASGRWVEAVKELQYRNVTRPRSRKEALESADGTSFARSKWTQLRGVARYAEDDDTVESEGDATFTDEQREEHRKKQAIAKRQREMTARTMGLEYWLEMVDQPKHRYGSHLRKYHAAWKAADTHENYFYWLDYGEGKAFELPTLSREKLEKDQVRYLTREERLQYLVKIDADGRLRWAKNGQRVHTSPEYKDSMKGIVPINDKTQPFRERDDVRHGTPDNDDGIHGAVSSSDSEDSTEEGQHYVNTEIHEARGMRKLQRVSAATVLNHLLQKTTKKNTWIFVADTSFRLYIGIKHSGAFQHSSFLHGARISAAGLIRVRAGRLQRLSPLSGHYRPPTANFRAFVATLRDAGADMSRVSISRSYAVLLGLEGYKRGKATLEGGVRDLELGAEKLLRPDEARRREEEQRDKSASAAREVEFLEAQRRREAEARRQASWTSKLERIVSGSGRAEAGGPRVGSALPPGESKQAI